MYPRYSSTRAFGACTARFNGITLAGLGAKRFDTLRDHRVRRTRQPDRLLDEVAPGVDRHTTPFLERLKRPMNTPVFQCTYTRRLEVFGRGGLISPGLDGSLHLATWCEE